MSTSSATPAYSPSPALSSSILRKQKMSITQTYFLAHKARAKLSHEAAMPDHNLRLLVGHANLLDSLMLELADAEREQESWFNQSVRSASQHEKKAAEPKHIQWADTIVEEEDEEEEDDYEDSSSDDDDDSDIYDEDEDVEMADAVSLRRMPSNSSLRLPPPPSPKMEVLEVEMDEDFEDNDDDEEDYAQLTLTRSPSHSIASPPPELEHDSDESSEDEAMPPSPPSTMLPTFESQQKNSRQPESMSASKLFDELLQNHERSARNPPTLVSTISVY